jgi:hypothetical protein
MTCAMRPLQDRDSLDSWTRREFHCDGREIIPRLVAEVRLLEAVISDAESERYLLIQNVVATWFLSCRKRQIFTAGRRAVGDSACAMHRRRACPCLRRSGAWRDTGERGPFLFCFLSCMR